MLSIDLYIHINISIYAYVECISDLFFSRNLFIVGAKECICHCCIQWMWLGESACMRGTAATHLQICTAIVQAVNAVIIQYQ